MSISRYMVTLLDAPPIRSGKRGYMDCGFPAALVSRVILRSVRRARTAFWQFSRLPRRPYSRRPEPPTRPLTHNRCLPSPNRHLRFTRSSHMFPRSVTQVYLGAPPFPCLVHAPRRFIHRLARSRKRSRDKTRSQSSEEIGTYRARTYSAFNTCDSTARDVRFGVYMS